MLKLRWLREREMQVKTRASREGGFFHYFTDIRKNVFPLSRPKKREIDFSTFPKTWNAK